MSTPTRKPTHPCKVIHENHTHGRERPGMPVHCASCGKQAPGHAKRIRRMERTE